MPDWIPIIRKRIGPLHLNGPSESEVLDELAEHLEDRYRELLASGVSEAEARELTMEDLNDSPSLVEALQRARPRPAPEAPSGSASPFAFVLYDFRMACQHLSRRGSSSVCW